MSVADNYRDVFGPALRMQVITGLHFPNRTFQWGQLNPLVAVIIIIGISSELTMNYVLLISEHRRRKGNEIYQVTQSFYIAHSDSGCRSLR